MKTVKKTAKRYYVWKITALLLACCIFFSSSASVVLADPNPSAGALPYGWSAPYGGVGVTPGTNRLDVTAGNGSVINWQNFDIGADGTVQFFQPGSQAAVLNRVVGAGATGIFGKLLANGCVFVINRQGVVFGPASYIRAQQFVASGLSISDTVFRNHVFEGKDLRFEGFGGAGNVTNFGEIQAAKTILVGKNVYNFGTITKRDIDDNAYVALGAGDKVYFGWDGSNIVVEKLLTLLPGNHVVDNQGQINTNNGKIFLAAGDIFSKAIDNVESLTAKANRNIHFDGPITASGKVFANSGIDGIGGSLYINDNIEAGSMDLKAGEVSSYDATRSGVYLADGKTLTSTEGDIDIGAVHDVVLGGAVTSAGNLVVNGDKQADNDHSFGGDVHAKAELKTIAGDIDILGNDIRLDGPVEAQGNLRITGRTSADGCGKTLFNPHSAWGDVFAADTLFAGGDIDIWVTGHEWVWDFWPVFGHYEYMPGTITLNNHVTATGDLALYNDTFTAPNVTLSSGWNLVLKNTLNPLENCSSLTGQTALSLVAGNQILAPNTAISVIGSFLLLHQSASLNLADFIFGNQGSTVLQLNSTAGSVTATDSAHGGKDENAADQWASISANAETDITLQGTGSINAGQLHSQTGNIEATSNTGDIIASGPVNADGGNITFNAAENIRFKKAVQANGDVTLTADSDKNGSGDMTAESTITSDNGSISIYASDNSIYLHDDVQAGLDILLNNNAYAAADIIAGRNVTVNGNLTMAEDFYCEGPWFGGYLDQTVQAKSGTLTAEGWIRKVTPGNLWLLGGSADLAVDLRYAGVGPAASTCLGNLSILGTGDIQISGDLTTFGPCCDRIVEPDLQGTVGAYSEPYLDALTGGVAVISDTGKIYTRDGINDDTLNVSITGNSDHLECVGVDLPKNYDIPADETGLAAIVIMSEQDLKLGPDAQLTAGGAYYADGSVDDRPGVDFLNVVEGDKNPGSPIDVAVYLASNMGNVSVGSAVSPLPAGAAMVVDAYDTVLPFGTNFVASLAAGNVGWLEACSRITPSLPYAIINATLPYAADPGLHPGPGTYVLRGESPDVGTGAWVLASAGPAPLTQEAGEQSEQTEFAQGGCPALMQWFGQEIGIPGEDIQVYMANAFALSTDIQPCEMCARLKNAADVLDDPARLTALARVVNEYVTPAAPPTPEQMALIATAVSTRAGEGTYYADAAQYIDALAEYVGIMNNEMGWGAADAVALVTEKHAPATDNQAVISYVQARLTALGG